jgi:hypothetical protein
MKTEFAKLMLDKNFNGAATLIFETTLKVQVPDNVKLNINIDREKNINDLAKQMESCYDQINDAYSELAFDALWSNVFETAEFSEKQNLKSNDIVISKAKSAYDSIMNKIRVQQYEQIFETTALTLNATLQGLVNAAIQI